MVQLLGQTCIICSLFQLAIVKTTWPVLFRDSLQTGFILFKNLFVIQPQVLKLFQFRYIQIETHTSFILNNILHNLKPCHKFGQVIYTAYYYQFRFNQLLFLKGTNSIPQLQVSIPSQLSWQSAGLIISGSWVDPSINAQPLLPAGVGVWVIRDPYHIQISVV